MKSEFLKKVMEVVTGMKRFVMLLAKGVLFFLVNKVFFQSLYDYLRRSGVLAFSH